MCKLFYLASQGADLIEGFELVCSEWSAPEDRNAGPGDDVPVILDEAPDKLTHARWGLVPSWSRSPAFGRQLVNARSDSLLERPAYRSAFRSRRCVILVDGFHERMRNRDGTRCLVRFHLASGKPMMLAGLWETWNPPEGESLRTCTMITVPANAFVGRIHGRMPAVLTPGCAKHWLAAEDPEEALALLQPCPDDMLVCTTV